MDTEATADALDAAGWFHPGDKARVDDEGFFYIVGRARDRFIAGGVNVYPAEVEAELLLHPRVEDAAVIGVDHPRWGEVGAAFVVPRGGAPLSAGELAAFLSPKLSHRNQASLQQSDSSRTKA
jgi:fatty-acyl-CoA synthase